MAWDLRNPPPSASPPRPLSELLRENPGESGQKLLHEQIRSRLHPNTCRICRQELTYARDVGRFPLEEDDIQLAYRAGRGYRYLLTVWWGRVIYHLPPDAREMPAVSSYYRHMSQHLGLKTEHEPLPVPPPPAAASVPVGAWELPRLRPPEPVPEGMERSILQMAKAMVEMDEMARRSLAPSHPLKTALDGHRRTAEEWLSRFESQFGSTGGFASSPESAAPRKARAARSDP